MPFLRFWTGIPNHAVFIYPSFSLSDAMSSPRFQTSGILAVSFFRQTIAFGTVFKLFGSHCVGSCTLRSANPFTQQTTFQPASVRSIAHGFSLSDTFLFALLCSAPSMDSSHSVVQLVVSWTLYILQPLGVRIFNLGAEDRFGTCSGHAPMKDTSSPGIDIKRQ